MNTRKSLTVASCLTVFGLFMASCTPTAVPTAAPVITATQKTETPMTKTAAAPTTPTASPKPGVDQPARAGGVLTIGIGGDPVSLDIHREESSFTNAITAATYSGLLKPDSQAWPEFKPVPDLATSWELRPDGKVYTFHLVKEAKWHDGTPVTSEDVKFSFDRIRDPQAGLVKSPRRQQLAAVASIDTPDDKTVKITLSYPQASLVSLVSTVYFAVIPKHVAVEKKNDMTKTVVGSGAFKFKNYTMGVLWELDRNPNYFVEGRPYLDGVKGYIITDSFARFAALRTKNVLWWAPYPYMSTSQTRTIEETLSDKIAVKWGFHPAGYSVYFNLGKPPWSDVRVRQAVTQAFDRKKMLAVGLEGAGVVGMSAQPPGEWALPEEEMVKVPGYAKPDLEGAKRLLAEAGFPNGFSAECLVRSTKPHQDMAVLFKDAVAAIGIRVDLKVLETAIYQDALFRKAFGVAVGGSSAALMDPDAQLGDFYLTGASRNWAGYSNPLFDDLYVKQSRTLDMGERRNIVLAMQRILLKEVPVAIAYWTNVPYAWWKEVKGYVPPVTFHSAFGYEDIWLAK